MGAKFSLPYCVIFLYHIHVYTYVADKYVYVYRTNSAFFIFSLIFCISSLPSLCLLYVAPTHCLHISFFVAYQQAQLSFQLQILREAGRSDSLVPLCEQNMPVCVFLLHISLFIMPYYKCVCVYATS